MKTILKNFWLVVAVAVVASVALAALAAAPAAPEKHYFVITIDGANIAINCTPEDFIIKLQRAEQKRLKDYTGTMPHVSPVTWSREITAEKFSEIIRTSPLPKQPYDFKSP